MKAVTTALVLIAGAAVVLWYGNTLNSWVLGGLIGGLAALLLSIPISLTLFSYLSRRHDDQLRAEVEEEISLARSYDYPHVPTGAMRGVHEVESYMLPEEVWHEEEEQNYQGHTGRNLPVPSYPRTPMVDRGQMSHSLPATQHETYAPVPPALRPQSKAASGAQKKDETVRRTTAPRRMSYPGYPGYVPGSFLSQHRSAALRIARQEAQEQYDDDVEVLPTNTPRRLPSVRSNEAVTEQNDRTRRPTRQLPPQSAQRLRRTVDATPSQNGGRPSLPAGGESTAAQQSSRYSEPHTDHLHNNYPQTGPMRRSIQTGQIARNPQKEESRRDADVVTGSLKNPLVRRAPYMYEDDPLRQELAQQIERPSVRRSSRYAQHEDNEE